MQIKIGIANINLLIDTTIDNMPKLLFSELLTSWRYLPLLWHRFRTMTNLDDDN